MIRIDGVLYPVAVKSITRTADFLETSAERTADGVVHIDPIGVYYNYAVEFAAPRTSLERADYGRLWQALTAPTRLHDIEVPDEAGSYRFRGYCAGIGDKLHKQLGQANYWQGLTVQFKAEAPARREG